eukprot:15352343-Ditylum_brightwellii.AAC.1
MASRRAPPTFRGPRAAVFFEKSDLLGEIPRTQGQRVPPGNGNPGAEAAFLIAKTATFVWQELTMERRLRHSATVSAKLCHHLTQRGSLL